MIPGAKWGPAGREISPRSAGPHGKVTNRAFARSVDRRSQIFLPALPPDADSPHERPEVGLVGNGGLPMKFLMAAGVFWWVVIAVWVVRLCMGLDHLGKDQLPAA